LSFPTRRSSDLLEDLCAERLELGDEDAQDVGATGAQAAGHQRGLVAEPLDDLLHPLARRGGHAVAAVDDLGDGRHRDAGGPRDVVDGDPASHGDDPTVSKTLSITIDTPGGGLPGWPCSVDDDRRT